MEMEKGGVDNKLHDEEEVVVDTVDDKLNEEHWATPNCTS